MNFPRPLISSNIIKWVQPHIVTQLLIFQSLSHVPLFVTPWTAACQASLSSAISCSLLKFMSIALMMLSNHSYPSASVLPQSIQGWFSLGLTTLICFLCKGLSRVFSCTTIRKHQFFGTQPFLRSNSHIRTWLLEKPSDQIRSVSQSCPILCDPMNCNTPGLPVHHQLLEFTQTHVHRVSEAIQPSHPLSSSFPPAPNPSQHQSLFQWVNSLHEVAKVLEFQL